MQRGHSTQQHHVWVCAICISHGWRHGRDDRPATKSHAAASLQAPAKPRNGAACRAKAPRRALTTPHSPTPRSPTATRPPGWSFRAAVTSGEWLAWQAGGCHGRPRPRTAPRAPRFAPTNSCAAHMRVPGHLAPHQQQQDAQQFGNASERTTPLPRAPAGMPPRPPCTPPALVQHHVRRRFCPGPGLPHVELRSHTGHALRGLQRAGIRHPQRALPQGGWAAKPPPPAAVAGPASAAQH